MSFQLQLTREEKKKEKVQHVGCLKNGGGAWRWSGRRSLPLSEKQAHWGFKSLPLHHVITPNIRRHPGARSKGLSGITGCSYKTINSHLNVPSSLLFEPLFTFFLKLSHPVILPYLSLIHPYMGSSHLFSCWVLLMGNPCHQSPCVCFHPVCKRREDVVTVRLKCYFLLQAVSLFAGCLTAVHHF